MSGEIELSKDDVEFSYTGKTPYIMMESEQENVAVFIDTTRSSKLISMGLMKDIARNIQQLRKKGVLFLQKYYHLHISRI